MASTDLLISQYRGTAVEKIVAASLGARDELLGEPLRELGRMLDVRQARGVWLDAIGAKVGAYRPHEGNPLAPMTDERYRRCVLARGALLGGGTFGDGLAKLDPWATWGENLTSSLRDGEPLSIRVWTLDPGLARLADVMGCVWRPAGVSATYYDYSLTPSGGFWATATTSHSRSVLNHEIAPPDLTSYTGADPNDFLRGLHVGTISLPNSTTLQISFPRPSSDEFYLTRTWRSVGRHAYNGWLLNVDEAVGLPAFSLDLGELPIRRSGFQVGENFTFGQLNIPLTAQQYAELHSHTPRVFRFRRKPPP